MLADERRLLNGSSHSLKTLKGNEPLFLDDPATIWWVRSGTLAIFAISVQDRTLKGRRRYLFTVKAGEIMVPASLSSVELPCKLMAIALEDVELQSMHRETFDDRALDGFEAIASLETWIYQLQSALSGLTAPRLPTPVNRTGLLVPHEVYQPPQGTVVWIRLLHGCIHLVGLDCLNVIPGGTWLPLSAFLWCEAVDRVELDVAIAPEQLGLESLLAGLDIVQTYVLKGIQHLEQYELDQEHQRFHNRERLNTEAVTETLSEFVSVLNPPTSSQHSPLSAEPSLTLGEALLSAAGAVGRSLGITICPPAASDDARRRRDPLEAIARASQIRMRRVTLRDQWWTQDGGALLAYTVDNQPVALLPRSETAYDVFNPLTQTRQRCDAEIAASLSTTAYTFYRPLPSTIKPLPLLRFASRGHIKEILMVLIAGIATTLLGMVTPQATGLLIDQAIPSADRRLLLQIALGLAATVMGTTLFQLAQGIAIMRLETYADSVTQAAVWDRLLKLKASFFRQYSIGDLSSRVSSISQIRQKLGHTIIKSLFSSVFSLLNLGLLFYYSIPLALIATGVAGVNVAVTVTSGLLTLKKVRPLLDQQGKLFGMMVQLINGVAKFRVAGAESRAFAHWGRQYSHQLKLTLSTQGIEDNLAVVNQLLSALTPAVLFAFATGLIQNPENDSFSAGTFLAFNAAFGTFIGGVTSLSTTVVDVLEILPIWQRTQPILQAQPEVDLQQADPGRLAGQIIVDHVVFRYRPEGALTLDKVCIKADPGEFIALVGPSGSGKSTLFRLLLGFDTPESGTIYFDGQDAAGVDMNAVRRQMGVVLQNSRLMSASIFENISSNAVISMDEAWDAARMAGLADDVLSMPMGMHTVVSEGGSNLSGGQRQRLLIARSLALRPRILLFDEATSALDNKTQAIVSESLDRLKVTRIVVAHRLSTIRNADCIYVLQQGRVVQAGRFEELAATEGLFHQLIQRQQM